MEEIEIPNQESVKILQEKENYTYLVITEANINKQTEMKEKSTLEEQELLETKICRWNLIKEINTWINTLVRYFGPFLKWTRKKLI